jgi:hypothetical protein
MLTAADRKTLAIHGEFNGQFEARVAAVRVELLTVVNRHVSDPHIAVAAMADVTGMIAAKLDREAGLPRGAQQDRMGSFLQRVEAIYQRFRHSQG